MENIERKCNVAAIMSTIEGPHIKGIDAEDLHERDEVDIPALIRKLEADEERRSGGTGRSDGGSPSGPRSTSYGIMTPLRRLTEYRNKAGDVSSALAWEHLTTQIIRAPSRMLINNALGEARETSIIMLIDFIVMLS